ncbi:MAG: protein kinase [Acidobacteria bacterium]|nr:protein kinase [Acidobacteriota bacterium]
MDELQPNTTLSHYRIVAKLGAGGMGEVWLAEDERLDRQVALKLLPAEFTQDAGRVRRFGQEAKAASALNHPNIITVYDIGQSEAGHFIVMELVVGRTLRAVIAEDNSLETLLTLGHQMARALSAAHAAGITHRDTKPDNIMVRNDGYVKVLDFGLARLLPATANGEEAATLAQQTTPGTIMGTVAYMSPEQTRGETVNHLSDIFALGIVLYELATRQHPFQADTLVGYLHAITLQTPAPPQQWQPKLSATLNDLLLRMLAKDASQRPTASEVAQALQAIERGEIARAQSVESETMILQGGSEFNLQVAGSASTGTLKRELSTSAQSIAVLPFANISADEENEYFCDGLAEELLNALSKIEALHVAARTSSFSFKGKETDIREIGQKLNVGAVLEGSVRKSGNRLRITAQLINISDGYHLWSERYDRQMEDIFDIQDEISLAIVDALKVKLLGAEKAAVTKRYTDNLEAYELYLKGRFHYGKWTEEGLKKSVEFFYQAISQEPNFAPAYAGVVNAYVFLWFYGLSAPDESIPIIKSAASRAVAIDNDSAESQFALTRMKFLYEWDWSGADRGFRRTLALNPNHAEAHEQYAILLAVLGRADEAIAMGNRALELDPLFLNTRISVGFSFWILGQYKRFREQGEKLIEFAPDFFGGYWQIGVECWEKGKYEEAIAALQKSVACGATPMVSAYLGYLYGLTGKRDEAQKILDQLQELSAQRHLLPFELAVVNVGLGELDRAFELLETAYEQRAGILIYFKYIAKMMPGFRDESRLTNLLRRIGLPE